MAIVMRHSEKQTWIMTDEAKRWRTKAQAMIIYRGAAAARTVVALYALEAIAVCDRVFLLSLGVR
jgi:hypothetical protein